MDVSSVLLAIDKLPFIDQVSINLSIDHKLIIDRLWFIP